MAGEGANLNCSAKPDCCNTFEWQLDLCQCSPGWGFAAQLPCSEWELWWWLHVLQAELLCARSKLRNPGNLHTSVPCRNVSLCVKWGRAGGDRGQRVRGRAVDPELRIPRGGLLHLAARGAEEGPAHQRGHRDPALPHLHVRGGRAHHQVEVSLPKGNRNQEQTNVSPRFCCSHCPFDSFVIKQNSPGLCCKLQLGEKNA